MAPFGEPRGAKWLHLGMEGFGAVFPSAGGSGNSPLWGLLVENLQPRRREWGYSTVAGSRLSLTLLPGISHACDPQGVGEHTRDIGGKARATSSMGVTSWGWPELEGCGGGEGSRDGIESVPPDVRRGNQAHAILQECMAWPRHGRECGALACICVGMCTCLRTRGCVRVVPACALWQSLCASNICGLPGV